MKGKLRIFAFSLALLLLLSPLAALGEGLSLSPAARLNVTVSSMTPLGELVPYGPAVPLTDAPDENRLWLTVSPSVFSVGRMSILIEDVLGEYVSFSPPNGGTLEKVQDAGESLDAASVNILMYDAAGTPAGVCYLYISSQERPGAEAVTDMPFPAEPTEAPEWPPVEEEPTEAPEWPPVEEEPTEAPEWPPVEEEPTEAPEWPPVEEEPTEAPEWPPVDENPTEAPAEPAFVTIRYLDETGVPIAPDTTLSVTPGLNTVYPDVDAQIPADYELDEMGVREVFADAEGVNPPVVEFRYALKQLSASVKINYVDAQGTPLLESTFMTPDGGEHPVFAQPIDGYAVVGESTRTVFVDQNGANPAEITFVYEREVQPASVIVHYVDQNGEALRNDDEFIFGKGEHYTQAIVLPGYMVSGAAEQAVYVDENGAQPREVTFVYQREVHPAVVPIHYVDENGEAIAPDTAQTVTPAENRVWPAGAVSAEDYELISPETAEVQVDADGAHPAEVIFQYRRIIKAASVVVHYVDDLGQPIAEDSVVSVPGGDSLIMPQVNIDPTLYALTEPTSHPVSVTLEGAVPNEITFTYQRLVQPALVTVHYVDEAGKPIAPDAQALYPEGDHQVVPGAEISRDDYTLIGPGSYPLTVTLEGASASEFTFTFHRVVKPAQVTVHYVDEDGETVAEDTVQLLTEGANVVFPQAWPENYALPEDTEPFLTVVVDAEGAHPPEVTFVYQLLSAEPAVIPVLHIDQDSGEEIASRGQVTVNRNAVTEVSALPAPQDLLPGYLLTSEPIVSVSVNSHGESNVQQVVFSYRSVPQETAAPELVPTAEIPAAEPTEAPAEEILPPEPVTVIVHYADGEGNPLAQDGEAQCGVGDTVVSAAPVDLPEGYVPDGPQEMVVHVDENGAVPAEITFYYRDASDVSAPKVALVNIKYLDPEGNVFYAYPTTCVEGRENPITLNWEYIDPALGYELTSPETVFVSVDAAGNAYPAEVKFQFKTDELNASLPVYYRDQVTGAEVAPMQEKLCYKGSNTIDADPFGLEEGYVLSSPSSVTVTLNPDGSLIPAEVVFLYWREVTPEPEATAAPFAEPMDAWFYPTGPSVRVRSAPSTTENNTLGLVTNGDLGHILGRTVTDDGKTWYSVEIGGLVGYMSDTVVRFLNEAEMMALFNYTPGPTALPTPVPTEVPAGAPIDRWAQTNAKVNFRRTPEKSGQRISELHKNDRVWVYSAEESTGDKWYYVSHHGADGYVMADYLDLLSEAESEQIQRNLASPVPTQVPPPTPVPTAAPSLPPTPAFIFEPTPDPTEVSTPDPTEPPTPEPALPPAETLPPPTETPVPYRGYALTITQIPLREDVSMTESSVLQLLPAQKLVDVKTETYVDGVPWAHAQVFGSDNEGYIPMSALTPISNDEAAFYRDQMFPTPEVTATPSPEQWMGYAMTLYNDVPMRSYPDTNGEIDSMVPYTCVVYVSSQQYTDFPWHVVQYNGRWGYIRQDQLRRLSTEETAAYLESMVGGTPSPSPAPTPEPINQASRSSFGYAFATSGKVNLRSLPSKESASLRLLDNYAFALVLNTETNDEGTWYHVSQAGTEGYIRSDYFRVIPLADLASFIGSEEYRNANENISEGPVTPKDIQSLEDFNRNYWTNQALTATYEPFNPIATPAPGTETPVPTATPTPTAVPAPSDAAQIAPVTPTETSQPESSVKQGGAPWPWVLLGLAVVGGGGAYYAYTVHAQNKKRAEMRAQQAMRARSQAAAHPHMHAAQNNPAQPTAAPGQPVSRPAQPTRPAQPANRPVQPTNRPAQPTNRPPQPAGRPPLSRSAQMASITPPPANDPEQAHHQEELAYLPPRQTAQKPAGQPTEGGDTRKYSPSLTKNGTQVFQTRQTAVHDAPAAKPEQAPMKPAPVQRPAPVSPENAAYARPVQQPSASAEAPAAPRQRVRRTERHKDLYDSNDQA